MVVFLRAHFVRSGWLNRSSRFVHPSEEPLMITNVPADLSIYVWPAILRPTASSGPNSRGISARHRRPRSCIRSPFSIGDERRRQVSSFDGVAHDCQDLGSQFCRKNPMQVKGAVFVAMEVIDR